MSAYNEYMLELREAIALVPYGHKYVLSEMRTPGCPQLKPIMANEREILYFAGQKLYDLATAQEWAKAFMAWKGSEAERKKLARAELNDPEATAKRVEEALAKTALENAAGREMRAGFRAHEEDVRQREQQNQADAFKRAGIDPAQYAAERERLAKLGMA